MDKIVPILNPDSYSGSVIRSTAIWILQYVSNSNNQLTKNIKKTRRKSITKQTRYIKLVGCTIFVKFAWKQNPFFMFYLSKSHIYVYVAYKSEKNQLQGTEKSVK